MLYNERHFCLDVFAFHHSDNVSDFSFRFDINLIIIFVLDIKFEMIQVVTKTVLIQFLVSALFYSNVSIKFIILNEKDLFTDFFNIQLMYFLKEFCLNWNF